MEISNKQAETLLHIKKKVVADDGNYPDVFPVEIHRPMNLRINLISIDGENTFLWEIFQSRKGYAKISLHIQDSSSSIGLLRVDYNGSPHTNPKSANVELPDKFRSYIGKFLNESHVHYYVNGYKPLAWALPIDITDIDIKVIDSNDANSKLPDIIFSIAKLINIETQLQIQPMTL